MSQNNTGAGRNLSVLLKKEKGYIETVCSSKGVRKKMIVLGGGQTPLWHSLNIVTGDFYFRYISLDVVIAAFVSDFG